MEKLVIVAAVILFVGIGLWQLFIKFQFARLIARRMFGKND